MQKSERTQMLERLCAEKGKRPPENNYQANLHYAAINLYLYFLVISSLLNIILDLVAILVLPI